MVKVYNQDNRTLVGSGLCHDLDRFDRRVEDDVDRLVQADPFLLVAVALSPLVLFTKCDSTRRLKYAVLQPTLGRGQHSKHSLT